MTTLIKNVQLIRGNGSAPERKDVLISNQKISAIGSFSDKIAINIYDGKNYYLSAGWIDAHSEIDHQAIARKQEHHAEVLSQGIATVICGHDGVSLAPASSASLLYFKNWGGQPQSVNWQSFGDYLSDWNNSCASINMASLVGYSTIRSIACAGHYSSCSTKRYSHMSALLKNSLSSGALGMSADLHLGRDTSQTLKELEKLSKILAEKNRVLVLDISPGSFGKKDDFLAWLKNIPCRIILDNFHALSGKEENLAEELSAYPNVYLEYPTGGQDIPIFRFLPEWFLQNDEYGWFSLRDPWLRKKVLKDMPSITGKDLRILRTRHSPAIVGLSLAEYAKACEIREAKEALLHLAASTHGQTTLTRASRKSFPHWLSLRNVIFGGQSARVSIESKEHPGLWHGERETPQFLSSLINGKTLNLLSAIEKMTSIPAEILGLKKQGIISEGLSANLTLFEIQPGPRHRDKLVVNSVFVNGRLAWEKSSGTSNSNYGRSVKAGE